MTGSKVLDGFLIQMNGPYPLIQTRKVVTARARNQESDKYWNSQILYI
jgi:hypothetical protein